MELSHSHLLAVLTSVVLLYEPRYHQSSVAIGYSLLPSDNLSYLIWRIYNWSSVLAIRNVEQKVY